MTKGLARTTLGELVGVQGGKRTFLRDGDVEAAALNDGGVGVRKLRNRLRDRVAFQTDRAMYEPRVWKDSTAAKVFSAVLVFTACDDGRALTACEVFEHTAKHHIENLRTCKTGVCVRYERDLLEAWSKACDREIGGNE